MHGSLRLTGSQPPIELFARVVPYEIEDANRYSWHGDLHPYLHQRGTLILDNGTEIEVAVGSAFLRELQSVNG